MRIPLEQLHLFCVAWMGSDVYGHTGLIEEFKRIGWDFDSFQQNVKNNKWWVDSMEVLNNKKPKVEGFNVSRELLEDVLSCIQNGDCQSAERILTDILKK